MNPTSSNQYPGIGTAQGTYGVIVGTPATGEELTAQLLSYLGYIAIMISTSEINPNEYQAQLNCIIGMINAQLPSIETTDPAAAKILQLALSPSGGDLSNLFNANGSVNAAAMAQFTSMWTLGTIAPPSSNAATCLPLMIASWMSGTMPGQTGVPFNFQTATDPNTQFAYITYMSSLSLVQTQTSSSAATELQNFMMNNPNGFETSGQAAATFIAAYYQVNKNFNPNLIQELSQMSEGQSSGNGYAEFVLSLNFDATLPTPPGLTPQQAEDDAAAALEATLPNS